MFQQVNVVLVYKSQSRDEAKSSLLFSYAPYNWTLCFRLNQWIFDLDLRSQCYVTQSSSDKHTVIFSIIVLKPNKSLLVFMYSQWTWLDRINILQFQISISVLMRFKDNTLANMRHIQAFVFHVVNYYHKPLSRTVCQKRD